MKSRKKLILSSALLFVLVLVTIGVTYAVFTFSREGAIENTLETGTVTLTYTEGKTGITLNEAYPISDDAGKVLTGVNHVFDFTVQANLSKSMSINYEVTAVKIPITDMTSLEDNEVKLYLERAIDPEVEYQEVLAPSNFIPREEQSSLGSPSGSMILDQGSFTNQGTTIHNYRLRMWIADDAVIPSGESRKYGVRVNVYASQSGVKMDESCFTFDDTTGTIIGYSDNCSKDVVIPNQINGVEVVAIGDRSLREKGLTSVNISNTVKSIGRSSFSENLLSEIEIPEGVKEIGDFAFMDNRLTKLTIPSSVTKIGKNPFNNNQLSDEDAFIYKRDEFGNIDYTTIISYGGARRDNVVIPSGVTTIATKAFDGNKLTSVILPEGLLTIGSDAFHNNLLTSITIPSSVTSIGIASFNDNQLSDNEAFIYQRNEDGSIDYTTIVSYGGKNRDIVTIPDQVKTIRYYALAYNSLKQVIIPSGVTTIQSDALLSNQLTKIINKTGKSFNWGTITGGTTTSTFVTGTIPHKNGDIIVTSE